MTINNKNNMEHFFVKYLTKKTVTWLLLISIMLPACKQTQTKQPKIKKSELKPAIIVDKNEKHGIQLAEARKLLSEGKLQEAQIILDKILKEDNQQKSDITDLLINEVDTCLKKPKNYGTYIEKSPLAKNHTLPSGKVEALAKKRVSMHLQNAGIKDIILALCKVDDLNIIADQSLSEKQRITVDMDNVPLHELLDYIARNMGISFHYGENIIWVTKTSAKKDNKPNLETHIFELKHGFIPNGLDAIDTKTKQQLVDEPDNELDDALKTFLMSDSTIPAYKVFKHRNLLAVRDTRERLRLVEYLLQSLDREPQQIIIQARFITVRQSDLFKLGLELHRFLVPASGETVGFDALRNKDTVTVVEKAGNKTTTTKLANTALAKGMDFKRLDLAGNLPGNMTISGVLSGTTFGALLNALQELGTAKTLSAPRVTVANNHWARIHHGTTRYYFEEYDLESVDFGDDQGVRGRMVPSGKPHKLELGYMLDVKPSIGNNSKTIIMTLKPDISNFVEWEYFETAKLPIVEQNMLKTTVVVNSGETVVLGGTITKTMTNKTKKIPIISNIPYIGKFFTYKEKTDQPYHLLVFVTAQLVSNSGQYVKTIPTTTKKDK